MTRTVALLIVGWCALNNVGMAADKRPRVIYILPEERPIPRPFELVNFELKEATVELQMHVFTVQGEIAKVAAIQQAFDIALGSKTHPQGGVLTAEQTRSFLQACQAESQAKLVCEPRMLVAMGRSARLICSSDVPLPGEYQRSEPGRPVITPQHVGTEVAMTVSNTEAGLLQLSVELVHSQLGAPLQKDGLPVLNTRKIQTNVELPSGKTLLLKGGKAPESIQQGMDNPIVGEVILLITPKIVDGDE